MEHANVRFGSPLAREVEPAASEDADLSLEDDDVGEEPDKTTLLFFSHRSTLAAAYLTPPAEGAVLHVMAEAQDTPAFDLAKLVLDQVDPDVVTVNAGASDQLVEALQARCSSHDCSLEIRPESEFKYPKAKSSLLSLQLPIPPDRPDDEGRSLSMSLSAAIQPNAYGRRQPESHVSGVDEDEDEEAMLRKEMRMSGMIDFGQTNAVCAAGGLIGFLTKVKARGELRGFDDGGGLRIGGIVSFTPQEYMHISAETLSTLGVFAFESHAYTHSTAQQKQGLSLAALLQTTCTPQGTILLRSWLVRPLLSLADIRARHDAVECLVKPGNASIVGGLRGGLRGIKNLRRILGNRLHKGVAEPRDWRALLEFCFKMVQVRNGMDELVGIQRNGLIHKLALKVDTELLVLIGQTINETIDWDESSAQNRVCCKAGVDEALDEMKQTYAGLDSLLMDVADRLAPSLPADIVKGLNVTFFPQLGFLLAVELVRPWDEYDEDVLEGCDFQFYTDEVTYFKSAQMRDLDVHFGDIHSSMVDREIEIIYRLSEGVLQRESDLLATVEACAELDCLIAFAGAAVDWHWMRPQMTDENVIHMSKARHPLLEVIIDSFVPNSVLLHGGHGIQAADDDEDGGGDGRMTGIEGNSTDEGRRTSLMVLTGANASGKSIYGKMVALLTYMAHIGCYIPADAATIGVTDKIFTRLTAKESVSKLQSSFTIDLNQVSQALRNCTARSLLIVDEFGKGTITTDGAGLLAGTILHLLNRGKECPKAIVMTHFHELFANSLLPSDLPVNFGSMEVVIDETAAAAADVPAQDSPVTYLYRLAPTLSVDSHAAACARSQGISHDIIVRSEEVRAHLTRFEYLPLQDRKLSDEEAEQLRHAERVVRAFLARDYSTSSFGSRSNRDIKAELRAMLELPAEGDGDERE